jgi:hypothetical protein
MVAYCLGSNFAFMTKESSAAICPVVSGGQRCHGNEVRLHSHLGEGFAGDWGINKNLIILHTDFLSQGFGYIVCQPGTNEALEAAMVAYRSGSDFAFMTKESSAIIHPVAFGGRRCHGNEVRLHSHLGEGFAGDWGINNNCHMLFGQPFVWITNCYAI